MKTFFFILISSLVLFSQSGCLKNTPTQTCTPATIASEEPTIIAYAGNNGINYTRDPSGVYYEIVSPGSGATPTLNSKVFVTYTGKLLNGSVFDQQTNASLTGWQLGSLIQGWQIGLQLIQKGGKMKLIVPSSLAYGCNGGPLPANSILYFDIELVDVQ